MVEQSWPEPYRTEPTDRAVLLVDAQSGDECLAVAILEENEPGLYTVGGTDGQIGEVPALGGYQRRPRVRCLRSDLRRGVVGLEEGPGKRDGELRGRMQCWMT